MAVNYYEMLITAGNVMASLDDFLKVMGFVRVGASDWKLLAAKLGDEHLNDLVTMAGLTPEMLQKTLDCKVS